MSKPRLLAGSPEPPAAAYDADILILARERPAETEQAIASALAQVGVSRHLLVLDQGSCAVTRERLARAVAGRKDATLVGIDGNLGVAGGRNLAAALGHGRIIAGIDNDAEFAGPETLAGVVAAFDADPGLGALGLRILDHATGADDLTSWGYPAALLPRAGGCFTAATFVGAGHAIRRAAWEEAGGYDPALFFCWEEFDFCLRIIERGWVVRYRGDLAVRHRVSLEARLAWAEGRWYQFVRNRLYIERKYGAGWLALAPRIAAYAVQGIRVGAGRQTLRASADAARMAARMPVQPLSSSTRAYLRAHDRAHRGALPVWLWRGVLAAQRLDHARRRRLSTP